MVHRLRLPRGATIAAVTAVLAAFIAVTAIAPNPASAGGVAPGTLGSPTAPTYSPPPGSPDPSPIWGTCASEGQYCVFGGTQQVRYGLSDGGTFGRWTVRTFFDGTIDCTNAQFGGDPFPNRVKQCQVDFSVEDPGSTHGHWKFCASEGQTCRGASGKWIRYGAAGYGNGQEGGYRVRMASGDVPCTNAWSGADPSPNVVKACWFYNG
jgi:hypothetical protein